MDPNKQKLIDIFHEKVKGKSPDIEGRNPRHDGSKGNWLEEQFGKTPDADNHADFYGYELKNETTSKTTFGDWSANYYIYKDNNYRRYFPKGQDSFCEVFGKPNPAKNDRYSWSGSPVPRIDGYNACGQKLLIEENNDIVAIYSYSQDQRPFKDNVVPLVLRQENLVIARWNGETPLRRGKNLKQKLEDKFNDKGWFTCKQGNDGRYEKICFGHPFDYYSWLDLVRDGIVYFDSGMYQGNKRPYSMWRADNAYWEKQIEETYD